MSSPLITVAMIVKNESRIIERCLDSVVGLADGVIVIDTGSTDDTLGVITAWAAEHPDIQVQKYSRPWVDFAWNRTELVERARQDVNQEGYLLLLDADHVVEGDLSGLDEAYDAYMVELPGAMSYRMPYLVRASVPWRYVSPTHEYITSDEPFIRGNIDSLRILHYGDGGTRHEKFERDLALLEKSYAEDPNNDRTAFYLAETLKNSGQVERAIELYRHRFKFRRL